MRSFRRLGVRDVVLSPGSRSTPLSLAALDSGLSVHVRIDERSAGFFALGLSKMTGIPTALITTSGTAATELLPAVTEAHLSGVPLIVLTADRPPELQGIGAAQTIDQSGIYGRLVNERILLGVPSLERAAAWPSIASQLYAAALKDLRGPGPVHLNVPFDEPLLGAVGDADASIPLITVTTVHAALGVPGDEVLRPLFTPDRRGLFIVGAHSGLHGSALVELASEVGWPILSDPRSGVSGDSQVLVDFADQFLRSASARRTLRPEVVVRIGESWSSKVLSTFLSSLREGSPDCSVHLIPSLPRFTDPERVADEILWCDLQATLARAIELVRATESRDPQGEWLKLWKDAESAASSVIAHEIEACEVLDEPALASALLDALGGSDLLHLSSSMPIRDVEWFARKRGPLPKVLSNRGANGIDGVLSCFMGESVALSAEGGGGRAFCLIGDVALIHDFGALVDRDGIDATVVVVDNGGGAIFSFLPQHAVVPATAFDRVFATPPSLDSGAILDGIGIATVVVSTRRELRDALIWSRSTAGITAILLRSERGANLARHNELSRLIVEAVDASLERAT